MLLSSLILLKLISIKHLPEKIYQSYSYSLKTELAQSKKIKCLPPIHPCYANGVTIVKQMAAHASGKKSSGERS